jgi:hypothetical protein
VLSADTFKTFSFIIELFSFSLICTLIVVSPLVICLGRLTNYPFLLFETKLDMSFKGSLISIDAYYTEVLVGAY